MALSLDSISKKAVVRAPRILVLGVEKIGKSSFACAAEFEDGRLTSVGENKPIVMSLKGEEGVDDLGVPAFPTLNSVDELEEAIGVLAKSDHPYGTAVVDSVSALEPLVWEYACRRHSVGSLEEIEGGFGKGYDAAAQVFRELTEGFDRLRAKGMAVVLIGHVKVKRFDDPGGEPYDQYRLDLHEKAAAVLLRWVDVILFCNTRVVVMEKDLGFGKKKGRGIDASGGGRFLYTQKRPAHPGGGRGIYGQLPYELPLSWEAFQAAVASAMDNASKTTNGEAS